jgi:hypothetical protein
MSVMLDKWSSFAKLLNVPPKHRCEEPLGKNRRQDRHRGGRDNRASDEPSEIGVAAAGERPEVVDHAAHDKARDIVDDCGADEDGAYVRLAEIHVLGRTRNDSERRAQTRRTQRGTDNECFHGTVTESDV